MTPITLALMIFGIMLLLMVIRIPIAGAMFLAGTAGFIIQTGVQPYLNFLNNLAFARLANYDLSVIPLFILMGHFATQGGISKALFQFAAAVMGRFKGGLAMGAVLACGAFGAICGSSVATAATITGVALPEMKRHGYSGRLSTGTLAAGGTLGILIPPSVPLVIYAILTEQNIAKLFAAAMMPGQAPDQEEREKLTLESLKGILPIAIIFIIVFGGIYAGFFTPTEGAAVGASSTFLAALLKRELTWEKFLHCFHATALSAAMIFMIFMGADVMNASLARTQVPGQLAEMVVSMNLAPLMVVSGILLLYVVLGAVMDELSMLLLTIPIFFPIIMKLDFGMTPEHTAIWFGIMVLMTVGFGMLAPPVGLNVYVVNGMAKDVPLSESYKGIMPFLISDTIRTLLLLFFPGISLFLIQYLT
jgi:TRAP-type C4-dicarboxylate transport system permease large subunit